MDEGKIPVFTATSLMIVNKSNTNLLKTNPSLTIICVFGSYSLGIG